MVIATRPGASAHEMELEVTDPLEKNIRTMGEVESVTSSSFNDLAILEVELKSTVRDADVEQCWDMLRRKASDVQRRLPSGTSVVVQDDFGLVYGMLYALTGDGLTERQLSDYAGLLKRELGDLDGVARVEIYGEREECIDISILPEKMAMLGVSPAEALATLNGQNNVYYAGYYDNGPDRIRVAVADKFRAVKEIESMVIQGHEDDQLRLCDIARVEHGYAEPVRNEMSYEGQRALGIAVAAASGSDIVKVGAEVERCLAELQAERFPAGVACHKIFYQPERVKDALGTFLINLIESVVIVVAILMLTMGFRSGMIIGISLVVTVVGSFLILGMADGTMQRVSLAAFILAMGMLVDNAIVIVDGILIDLKLGKPRREAMTAIGRKTAMPLLGATLIAILSFLPIFLSPDTAGVYVRDLFIVLAVSLLLSWVLALVHVPLMADAWLGQPAAPAGGATLYDSAVYRWLRAALGFGLRHRWSSIAVALVLVGLSVWGYGYMRQGFFPDMVYDQLYMEYKLPEGTNSTRVKADLEEIRRYLKSRPEIRSVAASIGGTPARYNLVRSIATPSLSYGELIIDFESPEALERNIDDIQQTLSDRYPDAYVKLKRYNLMFKKYPIEVQFHGARSGRAAPVGRQCALHHGAHARGVSDYDRLGAAHSGAEHRLRPVGRTAHGVEPAGYRRLDAVGCGRYSGRGFLRGDAQEYDLSQMYGGRREAGRQPGKRAGLPDDAQSGGVVRRGAAPQTQIGSDRPQRVAGIRPAYRAAETGEPRRTGRVGGSRRSALQRSACPAGNVLACARHRDRGGAAGRRRTNRGDSASVRIRTVVGG